MQRGIRITSGSLKSAAKIAEDRAEESGAVPSDRFRGSVGIRMSGAGGQKFEFPSGTSRQAGEARPAPVEANPMPLEARAAEPGLPQPTSASALWNIFLGFFGRKR